MGKKVTPSVPFEDLHNYNGPGYACTNEDPIIFADLLRKDKRDKIGKAAGIASGGEIGFFVILPTVREELTLVDHSYGALYYCSMKFLMLRELGYKDTIKYLTLEPTTRNKAARTAAKKVITQLERQLPKKLQPTKGKDVEQDKRLDANGARNLLFSRAIRTIWKAVPEKYVKAAAERLELVRFVHGDFTDITDRGPFDLLYLSNLLGHRPRMALRDENGYNKSPNYESLILEMLKEGGVILNTGTISSPGELHKVIKRLEEKVDSYSNISPFFVCRWQYQLWHRAVASPNPA